MNLFPRKKQFFFTDDECDAITYAIQEAEYATTGEIRIYVESKCKQKKVEDRALQIFDLLKMNNTKHRNAVLLYLATTDHKACIFGDDGIHQKVSSEFWEKNINALIDHFKQDLRLQGVITTISSIGKILHTHFPNNGGENKNELSNEVVFGE